MRKLILMLCCTLMLVTATPKPAAAWIDLLWYSRGAWGGDWGGTEEPDKPDDHGWLPGQGPGGWMRIFQITYGIALL